MTAVEETEVSLGQPITKLKIKLGIALTAVEAKD
jgi:hypothetical protein